MVQTKKDKNKKYYESHKEEIKIYGHKYYELHKEEIKISRKIYNDLTKEKRKKQQSLYYQTHKKQVHLYYQHLKEIVFNYYSNGSMVCNCCGENDIKSLTIDHINNDGAAHRREMGRGRNSGSNMYPWLIKHNYPEGYQVLCMNCNCVKEWFGTIEHRKNKYINKTEEQK